MQNCLAIQTKAAITNDLVMIYGTDRARRILFSATDTNKLEARWRRQWGDRIRQVTEELLAKAERTGAFDASLVDFLDVAMLHSLDVMRRAIGESIDFLPPIPTETRLAKKKSPAKAPPPSRVPTSFRELRKLWDKYRKMNYIPPRQRSIAERVKKAYLKRVQAEWVKHGEAFRRGDIASRAEAVTAIMQGADVAYSRAKMIVETETTYYYNKTRRSIWDDRDDVTHYLFMSIRDHRTTSWCKTRHGLVYAKNDPLFKDESPPCHWNCRSEILPLTPANPRHAALIADQSRARRRNQCTPLPPEWRGR